MGDPTHFGGAARQDLGFNPGPEFETGAPVGYSRYTLSSDAEGQESTSIHFIISLERIIQEQNYISQGRERWLICRRS
jgi:hypothetical protein